MWTAPVPQEFFWSDRLHPYVRPIDAVGLDRWPRWLPRREFQTTTRPGFGQWVPRSVSHLGSIDPTICPSLAARARREGYPANRPISYAANAAGIRSPS